MDMPLLRMLISRMLVPRGIISRWNCFQRNHCRFCSALVRILSDGKLKSRKWSLGVSSSGLVCAFKVIETKVPSYYPVVLPPQPVAATSWTKMAACALVITSTFQPRRKNRRRKEHLLAFKYAFWKSCIPLLLLFHWLGLNHMAPRHLGKLRNALFISRGCILAKNYSFYY